MAHIGLVLLVFSFVCAVMAAWGGADMRGWNLIAACLAFLTAAMIFGNITPLFH
jgi:hypothetical protein